MNQVETIRFFYKRIRNCSECPFVKSSGVMVVNGIKKEQKFICSKLNIEVQANEIPDNCPLPKEEYEVAEIILEENININKNLKE